MKTPLHLLLAILLVLLTAGGCRNDRDHPAAKLVLESHKPNYKDTEILSIKVKEKSESQVIVIMEYACTPRTAYPHQRNVYRGRFTVVKKNGNWAINEANVGDFVRPYSK